MRSGRWGQVVFAADIHRSAQEPVSPWLCIPWTATLRTANQAARIDTRIFSTLRFILCPYPFYGLCRGGDQPRNGGVLLGFHEGCLKMYHFFQHTKFRHKKKRLDIFPNPFLFFGSGGWIRTNDLRVMSPTSYQTAPPRIICCNIYYLTVPCQAFYAEPRERADSPLNLL